MKTKWFFFLICFLSIGGIAFAQTDNGEDVRSVLAALPKEGRGNIQAISTTSLTETLRETSGLVLWGGRLWTINDSQNKNAVYSFSPDSVADVKEYVLNGYEDNDWEEISQDSSYLYVGDFGNNYQGNRKNLRILKISKASILSGTPLVEAIDYSYPQQTDFSIQKSNHTDFDCEAMIVKGDSIYLFTKQWIGRRTSLYVLPNKAGTYAARYITSFNVDGLVTGATYREKDHLLVLCGYASNFTFPFIYVFYDFKGTDFFGGKKCKLEISNLMFHQVEGIASRDGVHYYISNEEVKYKSILHIPPQIHRIDLSNFLKR